MKRVLTRWFAALAVMTLIATAEEWQPSRPGYKYRFPHDHGQHPEHKIEWWYYTGNVQTASGRRFGYQLTFFRIGAVAKPVVASSWALRDVWMAHFAVSDLQTQKYHSADRLNRAGPGLAGASEFKVWNEDWSVMGDAGMTTLAAADRKMAVELKLGPGKPVVIHGHDGISQKGASQGNASHYYSLTRMPTTGTITMGNERFDVFGESWMDHEFGTTFLEKGTAGWDWFSAQLSDGSEFMLFQLRSEAGKQNDRGSGVARFNAGTFIAADGTVTALGSADFELVPGLVWRSPSGAGYPQRWLIRIPGHGIDLACSATMPNQEFRAEATPGLNYWEGAVDYQGTVKGQIVTGHGYLEMTGYSGQSMSVWFGE